jgi:hypothetical protein
MIEAYSLFSGSSGNGTLVRSGGTSILIDAGRSRRAVGCALSAVGQCAADLAGIFITHEHTDHISALRGAEGVQSTPCIGAVLRLLVHLSDFLIPYSIQNPVVLAFVDKIADLVLLGVQIAGEIASEGGCIPVPVHGDCRFTRSEYTDGHRGIGLFHVMIRGNHDEYNCEENKHRGGQSGYQLTGSRIHSKPSRKCTQQGHDGKDNQ